MYPGLEPHRARLDRLPTCLKAALAAACAQRQAEVYRAYVRRTGAGNAEAFDNLLTAIWNDIRRGQVSEQDCKQREAGGDKLLSQKNKSDIYGAGAEFAILSLLHSNDVLTAGKTQDTIYSSNQTFDSIDNFLTVGKKPQFDMNQADTNAWVLAHPLIVAEHRRQERDLSEFEQARLRPDTIPDALDRFRKSQADTNARIRAHPLNEAENRRQERDLSELEQALLRPNTIPDAVDRLRRRSEVEAKDFLPIIDGPGT
jgi:uncharacterized protein YjaG (DUF416 family)